MRRENEGDFLLGGVVGDWFFRDGYMAIETPVGTAMLPIDEKCKEEWGEPCWQWDGNLDSPTITPSIRLKTSEGVWHGWMRNGKLVEA